MRIENELKLGFKDVMIRPKRSTLKSRSQVSLERNFNFVNSKKQWSGVPIIAANMDTVGTFEMAIALSKDKIITAVHKHYTLEEWTAFLASQPDSIYDYIALSTGIGIGDEEKIQQIVNAHPKINFLCIDVANGYSEHFVDFVKKMRGFFPDKTIIAGNVVTGEMVEELILAGADVAHGLGGHIISDGGCKIPGDIAKAFGGGADFVMLGGMFAGHDESGGEIVEENGKKYRLFYGMSSQTAMDKHSGGIAEYRASEGKTVKVSYKGAVAETVKDILGGVRSTCTYVGAAQLRELSKRTTFIRVSEQENQIFGG